jgi:RHS repeat-associated protein
VYAYSAYGETVALGPDGGNPLQYTGRENDGTGLYYYRARYYDPLLKRFVSEDPIGMLGGISLSAYVKGNPVSFSDPSGHRAIGGSSVWQRIGRLLAPREQQPAEAGVGPSGVPSNVEIETKGAEYGEKLCKMGVIAFVDQCLEYCTSLITAGTGGLGTGYDVSGCVQQCGAAYRKCKYSPKSQCPVDIDTSWL